LIRSFSVARSVRPFLSAIQQNRHERELIAGGQCQKVMEALYTPPLHATTSCSSTNPPICSTSVYQADPYMRSLWRCTDPSRDGQGVEFWRATAEEFGK
jgi:hypothetical protein